MEFDLAKLKTILMNGYLCFRVLVYGGSGGVGTFAIQVRYNTLLSKTL